MTLPPMTRARAAAAGLLLAIAAALVAPPAPAAAAPARAAGGIRFTYSDPNAGAVFWAGDFNGWSASANPFTKGEGGVWSVVLALPQGEHAYKFVVDGRWVADPENPVTRGEYGNSVVAVDASGAIAAQQATSNSAYNPKILFNGRLIGIYQSIYSARFDRFEISRPTFDVDLGFDIRISDAMQAKALLNANPQNEDVQEFKSRLNFKRGSLLLKRPVFDLLAYDSENLPTWDDPLHLVGDMGPYHHPWGYQRQGLVLDLHHLGWELTTMFSDNFSQDEFNSDRYLGFRIDNYPTFVIQRPGWAGNSFIFENEPISAAVGRLRTTPVAGGYALVPDQVSKVSTLDAGDDGRLFGYGDNFEDVFAARLHREVRPGLRLGLLGRTDRGFGLGRIVRAEPVGDSTVQVVNSLYTQQWFGGGLEARWQARPGLELSGEFLAGARLMNYKAPSSTSLYHVSPDTSTVHLTPTPLDTRDIAGTNEDLDRSWRLFLGGAWTFASEDITLRASVERETHEYPSWTQAPVAPAGQPPDDHVRFETVDFQRATYLDAGRKLENAMTAWHLGWDRNWRYYLNRPVRTSLDFEWIDFDYDARTAWEHQLWFPTGNFWLDGGQHRASLDRLTVLGEERAVRVRPSLEVPLLRSRDMRFRWRGTFSSVDFDLRPRYAENRFLFGFDLLPAVRLESDTRWAKYDVPVLALGGGFLDQFTELSFRVAPEVTLSIGMGVDPWVIDPNTNEYADIGRELFLEGRYVSGYYAETNYLSGGPVIRAGERALQDERRFQVEAIVRF